MKMTACLKIIANFKKDCTVKKTLPWFEPFVFPSFDSFNEFFPKVIPTIVLFIPFFVCGFWSLLAIKLWKYNNITKSLFAFCKARWARQKKKWKENHATKVTKIPEQFQRIVFSSSKEFQGSPEEPQIKLLHRVLKEDLGPRIYGCKKTGAGRTEMYNINFRSQ